MGSTHFSLPWLSLAAAHDRKRPARHCIAAEVIGSTERSFTQYQVTSIRSYHYLHTAHKTIYTQNRIFCGN